MKVNTDGVLLGGFAFHSNPQLILDIGTGTGVIALMIAQRFPVAKVDAIEIDAKAANTARQNFEYSAFKDRIQVYCNSFQQHLQQADTRNYDLIVTNPPFFINSLSSNSAAKKVAKHADKQLFEELLQLSTLRLNKDGGLLELILPLDAAEFVKQIIGNFGLVLHKTVSIKSFDYSIPHREILTFGFNPASKINETLIIYNQPKEYTFQYQTLLKDFLTIF